MWSQSLVFSCHYSGVQTTDCVVFTLMCQFGNPVILRVTKKQLCRLMKLNVYFPQLLHYRGRKLNCQSFVLEDEGYSMCAKKLQTSYTGVHYGLERKEDQTRTGQDRKGSFPSSIYTQYPIMTKWKQNFRHFCILLKSIQIFYDTWILAQTFSHFSWPSLRCFYALIIFEMFLRLDHLWDVSTPWSSLRCFYALTIFEMFLRLDHLWDVSTPWPSLRCFYALIIFEMFLRLDHLWDVSTPWPSLRCFYALTIFDMFLRLDHLWDVSTPWSSLRWFLRLDHLWDVFLRLDHLWDVSTPWPSLRWFYALTGVRLWWIQLTGHDLERHTPVYIRSHSWQGISEQRPSREVEGTACRAQRQDCGEAQIWCIYDSQEHSGLGIIFLFFFKCIPNFSIFSQFGSQSHPHFSNYPVLLHQIHRTHPVPGGPRKDLAIQRNTPSPSCVDSTERRDSWHPRCGNLSPADSSPFPRSDEAIMSLQREPAKLSLGRGGIRDPAPQCVALANQRLRPLRHRGSGLHHF